MQNFQKKQTERKNGAKILFHEEFYFDITSPVFSFLGCWGIGYGVWKNSYGAFFHGKSEYISLELIVDGKFLFQSDGESRTLKQGSMILIGTKKNQCLRGEPGGKKWCLFFKVSEFSGMIPRKIFGNQAVLQLKSSGEIEQLYQKIYDAASRNDPAFEIYVFQLLETLYRYGNETFYPEPLNKVLAQFYRTGNWWCDRNELAETAGVSISTLNRMFHQYLNSSIGEYCQKQRMELACRLLVIPGISIKEAADKCGFSSSAFFCRTFRKYYHCTPGDYISRQRKLSVSEL